VSMTDLCRGRYRLHVNAPVRLRGPLHVGTGERLGVVSDAPLLRDANGNVWLPGSSVRGVLRDWCEREAPLLGFADPAKVVRRLLGTGGRNGDRRGRLTVLDAELPPNIQSEVRDHVLIKREYGAGAKGGKFDAEAADLGEGVATLHLLYEGDGPGDEEVRLLQSAVWALRRGLLSFGAKSGWGFGWAEGVADNPARWFAVDRGADGLECLARYLAARANQALLDPIGDDVSEGREEYPAPIANSASAVTPPEAEGREHRSPWSYLRLDLRLQFEGPMLVAGPDRVADHFRFAGKEGERTRLAQLAHDHQGGDKHAPDAAPFLRLHDNQPVLPGSSLRGAVRSHAERIVTTLGCPEIATTLFGDVKQRAGVETGQRGLLSVGEGLHDGAVRGILMDHVAIDRVTGFAVDQKLFSALALASPAFKVPFLLRWHQEDEAHRAALALILFVLRDMSDGLLWVGSRTTRGYGHLRSIQVKSAWASRVEQSEDGSRRTGTDRDDGALPAGLPELGQDLGVIEAWRLLTGVAP